MKLLTEVHISAPLSRINYRDNVMMAGSCFATNIGNLFLENKFSVSVNPFGVLYNPISVLQMLQIASGYKNRSQQDIVEYGAIWNSMAHHGSFSKEDKGELETLLQKTDNELKKAFNNSTWLFITWGTAWVFEYLPTGRIVANCHKIAAKEFNRFRLSTKEIVEYYSDWFSEVFKAMPDLNIVLTVSPVRHLKDTAHGNQLSKSVLLLAAEELCNRFKQVMYFPAYEIVLDELRDYRFFAEDMIHPNNIAINYIWEKLKNNWLSTESLGIMKDIKVVVKAAKHRPLKANTPQHQKFITHTLDKISHLNASHPELDFSIEEGILTQQLLSK